MGNRNFRKKPRAEEFEAQGIVFNKKRWLLYLKEQEHEAKSARKRLKRKIEKAVSKNGRASRFTDNSNIGRVSQCKDLRGEGEGESDTNTPVCYPVNNEEKSSKHTDGRNDISEDSGIEESGIPPAWYDYTRNIENIVMSGGGSKGYTFIGALKVRPAINILKCFYLCILQNISNSFPL